MPPHNGIALLAAAAAFLGCLPVSARAPDTPGSPAHETCPYANTTGRFGDEWNTGNKDPGTRVGEGVPPLHGTASPKGEPLASFTTSFERASPDKKSPLCYYTAEQFCIHNSALLFIQPSGAEPRGKLRLCNDLRAKINLPYRTAQAPPPGAVIRDRGHVLSCWQLYGYHLFLCLMAAWYTQRLHGFHTADMWPYNHAETLGKEVRTHFSMSDFYGNPGSWSDPHRPDAKSLGFADSAFWQMWGLVAPGPGEVRKLRRYPLPGSQGGSPVCYRRGLVGMVSPLAVPTYAKRLLTGAMLSLLGLEYPPLQCSWKMLVLVRKPGQNQGIRSLSNPEVVVEVGRSRGLVVSKESFEGMPLVRQAALAAEADVFVSSHGGGNTWIAMQRDRSVFIECWLDYPRRLVYAEMASGWNLRYYHVSQGVSGEAFLTQSVTVPRAAFTHTLDDALRYLNSTRCCG